MSEMQVVPSQVLSTEEIRSRKEQLNEYVRSQLVPDTDFGVLDGTPKPSLFQPGADKLLNLYGLTSRIEEVSKFERWEDPAFFKYEYKCRVIWPRLMSDGTIREEVLAETIGSCNSKESKYAWRFVEEKDLTPAQAEDFKAGRLLVVGREKWTPLYTLTDEEKKVVEAEKWESETRKSRAGNMVVWVLNKHAKKIRVPNDAIFDLVNTFQKMAQKRAYVGAVIKATKASDLFTQDLEDLPDGVADRAGVQGKKDAEEKPPKEEPKKEKPKEKSVPPAVDPKVAEGEESVALGAYEKAFKEANTLKELFDIQKRVPEKLRPKTLPLYSARCAEIKAESRKSGGNAVEPEEGTQS